MDDQALAAEAPPEGLVPPNGAMLLVTLDGEPVAIDTAHHLTAAISLYRSAGYREIPAFNSGPLAELWFERELYWVLPWRETRSMTD